MPDFLTSTYFKFFFVPLIAVALNLFVKINSRNDRHNPFSKEDAAVGPQLAVTAIVTFIIQTITSANNASTSAQATSANTVDLQNKIIALQNQFIVSLCIVFLLTMLLGVISLVIRKYGWEAENKLTWICGVIIPFVYGLGTLFLVVTLIGS